MRLREVKSLSNGRAVIRNPSSRLYYTLYKLLLRAIQGDSTTVHFKEGTKTYNPDTLIKMR